MQGRVAYLDGIRGVAISVVVLSHYFGHAYAGFLPYGDRYSDLPIIAEGGNGVELFFLVSGFVILLTLEKCASFGEFLYRRLLRLWPAMLLATILILAFNLLDLPSPQQPVGLKDALPGLTFISPSFYHAAFHTDFRNLDDVFWSLDVEMFFYFLFGTLYFKLGTKSAIVAMVAVSALVTLAHGPRLIEPFEWAGVQYFAWFGSGALFYRASRGDRCFWLAVIIGLLAAMLGQHPSYTLGQRIALFSVVAFFAAAQKSAGLQNVLSSRFLLFVGFISYPLYLLHARIGVAILSILPGRSPFLAILPLVPIVLVSWFCASRFEPYSRRVLGALMDRLQPPWLSQHPVPRKALVSPSNLKEVDHGSTASRSVAGQVWHRGRLVEANAAPTITARVEPPRRNQVLDGFRACAALGVVFAHSMLFGFAGAPHFLKRLAEPLAPTSVHVFFVISGYIITTLLLVEEQKFGRLSLLAFYVRRACRILPPLIAFYCGLVLLSLTGRLTVDPASLWASATFTCNLTECSWWVAHTWSLAVEEQFYLIWPVLFLLFRQRASVLAFAVLGLLLSCMIAPGHSNNVSFACIGAGALYASSTLLRDKLTALASWPGWLLGAAIAVLGPLYLQPKAQFIMPLVVLYLVFTPPALVRRILSTKPFQIVALGSYSLYLWQQVFLGTSERYAGARPSIWWLPCIVTLSVFLIEQPFIRLGRKLSTLVVQNSQLEASHAAR